MWPVGGGLPGGTGSDSNPPGDSHPGGGMPNGPHLQGTNHSAVQHVQASVEEYDPSNTPPSNRRELYVLLQYRLERFIYSSSRVSVLRILPSDSLIDRGGRALLLDYILDNRSRLPVAYYQLTDNLGKERWGTVQISSTSSIMRSLADSL